MSHLPLHCRHVNRAQLFKESLANKLMVRGQLVKYFTTLLPNTLIFFVEKMRSFCNAKASHTSSTKTIGVFEILTFEILTTCKRPGPDFQKRMRISSYLKCAMFL